jgi:hypothetical protein
VFTYSVEYGFITAGKASLSVVGIDTVSGIPAYHVRSRAESNPTFSTFFRVDDRVDSFVDIYRLASLRMEKHLREGSYRKDLEVDFDPVKPLAYYADGDTVEIVPGANDALSALYRLRTLDIAVGDVIEMPHHDNKKNYPLRVRVLRKERVRVPAGRFSCFVVEPYLKEEGIFKAKGKMNIYLTDDEHLMPVLVKTSVIIGSVNAKLEDYRSIRKSFSSYGRTPKWSRTPSRPAIRSRPSPIRSPATSRPTRSGPAVRDIVTIPWRETSRRLPPIRPGTKEETMKSKHRMLDRSLLTTLPFEKRKNLVRASDFAKAYNEPAAMTFFLESLPDILAARNLRSLVDAVVTANQEEKQVVVMMGGHVVKTGLSPILIDLVDRGVVTAIAMSGAAAIHDFEIAMFGETSEDVQKNILDGTFGMVEDTGRLMNDCITSAAGDELGLGEALGGYLIEMEAPNREMSILARGLELGIPVTVHVAIGTDIIHQHPACSGSATGDTTYRDFLIFAEVVRSITGGVVLNIGSAVLMPEVFLKALSMAQNISELGSFTTTDFDMIGHYRPTTNVVKRPARVGGTGYSFRGHHEIMIPLFAALVKAKL